MQEIIFPMRLTGNAMRDILRLQITQCATTVKGREKNARGKYQF
jgi:hypothetical protein